jgi:FkbM family methyltransferase
MQMPDAQERLLMPRSLLRPLIRRWPQAAWYAGKLGKTVRVDGCRIRMPSNYMAGLVRLGGYESAERSAVRRFLPRDIPLVELGCGIGMVACIANKRLRYPDRHVCVDGNPRALADTVANGLANGCAFRTLHAAIAYDAATVEFGIDESIVSGGLESGHRTVRVATTTLQTVLDDAEFSEASLICDIEGAELSLLQHEADVLRQRISFLLMETHPARYGAAGEASVFSGLRALGFSQAWRSLDVGVWLRK